MAHLLAGLKLKEIVKISIRYKHGPNHWSVLKKKKTAKDKALDHFDEYYGSVYGESWEGIRAALLDEKTKYMAVVNNFSDVQRIQTELQLLGAIHLKSLYNVFKEDEKNYQNSEPTLSQDIENPMDDIIKNLQLSELESFYPNDHVLSQTSLTSEEDEEDNKSLIETNKPLQPVELQSIEKSLNEIDIDNDRLIQSSSDQSMLYEYVPATKLKGLNDYVLESDYYNFYNKGADFKINIVEESTLPFPEHLHVYTFEDNNYTRFPSPKLGSTGVLDYYLFDGGSILPVLALDIKLGDVVLDMCAAPGGKALAILQTLMPRVLVANDVMESRVNKLNNVVRQYMLNASKLGNMLYVTENDARYIDDTNVFNKILVDVPCTTDRHMVHSVENNMFKPTRLKERINLPNVQSSILMNALKLVKVGGTVVYATCSLSPIQNDGVVQVALKNVWEETTSVMVVKDMSKALSPLKCLYQFANIGLKYGHIVVPTHENNWGPMYFCKIERIQ
ncbi:5-methylcytosine rRNA methyltransferase l(2)10685 [Nomia melanderi]|uniref:5-methylcytosine rRNA methyltransferase l(2)10685 n=1 Tax=Nomia melanderi TaxID=2448451 RepID=UPI003FCE7ADE